MKTEIALAVASVGMALSVAFPFPAQAGEIEDRFVYVGCGLGNREKVDKTIDVVRRAAKLGFNGLVLQGDIQYAWMAPEHERKNLARLKAACDEAGMDLIPAVWSIGYGTMLHANPNLAAGLPVFDVPYVVSADGRKATFVGASGDNVLPNGDLEEATRSADGRKFRLDGWTVEAPGTISFIDTDVKFSGRQSVRFELSESAKRKDPQARLSRTIRVKPNRRYRVSARLKTEGLDTTYGFQITIYTRPRKGSSESSRQLTMNRPRIKTTNDWMEMTAEISTLDYEELGLYLGSWHAREGRFWLDDVRIEEIGIDKALRRPGCPFSVRNAVTGERYVEGRDYAEVPPLKKGQEKMPRENGSLVLSLPAGSRIKPGARLLVSGYASHRMKSDSQVSTCMSEPELYRLFEQSAAGIEAAIHPRKWFLPLDEVRAGGTCAACRAKNTDMAHIFGACVTKQREIIRRVSPRATVYMWGDQLDPKMNARDGVCLCRGSFAGSVDLVPKDIVVMHWGGKLEESLQFFREKGFRTARSRSIDGKWANGTPAVVTDDYRIARGDPGCRGFMYTTWQGDYSQEKLEAFGRLWGGR